MGQERTDRNPNPNCDLESRKKGRIGRGFLLPGDPLRRHHRLPSHWTSRRTGHRRQATRQRSAQPRASARADEKPNGGAGFAPPVRNHGRLLLLPWLDRERRCERKGRGEMVFRVSGVRRPWRFVSPDSRGRPSDHIRRMAGTQAGLGPGGWTESQPTPTLRPGRGGAARAIWATQELGRERSSAGHVWQTGCGPRQASGRNGQINSTVTVF